MVLLHGGGHGLDRVLSRSQSLFFGGGCRFMALKPLRLVRGTLALRDVNLLPEMKLTTVSMNSGGH